VDTPNLKKMGPRDGCGRALDTALDDMSHWVFDPQTAVTIYLWAPCGSLDANECCTCEFYTYTKHMQRPRRVGHAQSVTRHRQRAASASHATPPSDRASVHASRSDL
jgi:IS1 family transposase